MSLIPPASRDQPWGFRGTFERDTLRGELLNGPGRGFTLEAVRTDTVPTGLGSITIRGAETLDVLGQAIFVYVRGSAAPALSFRADPPANVWISFDFPAPAQPMVYPVASSALPGGFVQGAVRTYLPVAGTVRIDRSNRIGLIGRFDFTARAENGDTVSVKGPFSAGCAGADC